jgi:cell division protein FtsQ
VRVPRDFSGLHETPEAPPVPWRNLGADERLGDGAGHFPGSDGRVLPFRRRSGLPVRRRSRWKELARHFLTAAALVGVPAAALWWSATSPRFDLAHLEVETTDRVNREWVEKRLDPLVGRNLVWMSMRSVERSLADHPWLAGVEVSKSLPDRMRVAVVERRPVAVLEATDGTFWVDREGWIIAPVDDAGAPPGAGGEEDDTLTLVELAPPEGAVAGSASAATLERQRRLRGALDAAQGLARVDTWWGSGLTEIEILGEEDLLLRSRELPFPLLVEAGTVEERARAFQRRLPELLARVPNPSRIDLRFEHRMVVRPDTGETGAGADDGRGELHGQTG